MKNMPDVFRTSFCHHVLVTTLFLAMTLPAGAATYSVTNSNNSGGGSFREAILAVNAQTSGDHTITLFSGLTIKPTSELDAIFNLYGYVTIEGNGSTLDGTDLEGEGCGLMLWTPAAVRNLTIINFSLHGVAISAADCAVMGCRIGTNDLGADLGNGWSGIIAQNATNLAIGSTNSADANWISHNGTYGIVAVMCNGMTLRRNYVGFNGRTGIIIENTEDGVIGGGGATGRNFVVSNGMHGIQCTQVTGFVISSNFVGLDIDGITAAGNGMHGIYLNGTTNSTIGGTHMSLGNVLCDNALSGLQLDNCDENTIIGNYIGASPYGKSGRALIIGTLGNAVDGIAIADGSAGNRVGGSETDEPNLITDNVGAGVRVTGATTRLNVLYKNSIFGNGEADIVLQDGANDGILPPVITGIDPVSGTASPGALLEFFAGEDNGEQTFIIRTVSDGAGNFSVELDLTPYAGTDLIATQTVDGNTSAFSNAYPIPAVTEGEGGAEGEGSLEGAAEGESEGLIEGQAEGVLEGQEEGMTEGTLEGQEEGLLEGETEGLAEGIAEGEAEGQTEGLTEGEGESSAHTADQNGDGQINLSELLRVIQFFNSGGYHCDVGGEDGYAPGQGSQTCPAHDSDYNSQDWQINLSELLRVIQFFNSGGYHPCPEGEDGFCPGLYK